MEDVSDVRIHEASLQMQVSRYRSQEFGKNSEGSGQAKRKNLSLITGLLC